MYIMIHIFEEISVSRPKPKILCEATDVATSKTNQILEADAIWAVFFKDRPFNLREQDLKNESSEPKYKKVSFSNRGHALNLCKKLNEQFNCDDFSLVKLTSGFRIK